MTFTVVGCGESAAGWIKYGTAIGSNDCEKFGGPVDHLILANAPHKFTPQRLEIIKKTQAQVHTTSAVDWNKIFPRANFLRRVIQYNSLKVRNNFIYFSQTTPIISMSLAVTMGAKEIILYGVDMMNHRVWCDKTKLGQREIQLYKNYFMHCQRDLKIDIYLGSHGTAFDANLRHYLI